MLNLRLLSRSLVALVLLVTSAFADVVVLKDGRRFEGSISQDDASGVKIKTDFGSEFEFTRAEVDSIERGKSRGQEFSERFAAGKTAEDLFGVGKWAESKNMKTEAKRAMRRAVELDRHHAGANTWLGRVEYKGEWYTPAERDALAAKDLEAEMTAKGLVRWKERWVTPEEKSHLEHDDVLLDGKWISFGDAQRKQGLEEYAGQWLPRAEALARVDVAKVGELVKLELKPYFTDDAVLAGSWDESKLKPVGEGLKKGRVWFDRTFKSAGGLELFGGRYAELYIWVPDEPYQKTVAHFASLTKTVPEGWSEVVAKTYGFLWWDPYPLSSARLWKRADDDMEGHCYHHWGHLLLNRLGYDGRLLPPWFDEGVASLMEFRVHRHNAVFCRGQRNPPPTGVGTGGTTGKNGPATGVVRKDPAAVSHEFEPGKMGEGKWRDALKNGLAGNKAPRFDELASRQFTELEPADIAASMAIVEWLESFGPDALRAFLDELRRGAPPAPTRVWPNVLAREEVYEKAFQAAVKLGVKDADQAWRRWFTSH